MSYIKDWYFYVSNGLLKNGFYLKQFVRQRNNRMRLVVYGSRRSRVCRLRDILTELNFTVFFLMTHNGMCEVGMFPTKKQCH